MSRTIQMKRGLLADLPQLLPGEFAFTIDTHEVFIGSAAGNVPMVNSDKIRELELDYETAAAALELTYAPELANLKASDTSINDKIASFNQTIASMNRGLGTTMASMAQLLSTYPTGDTKDHIVAGSISEVDTLTVTTIPTTAGDVTVTLNGVAKTVPVTVGRAEVASLLVTAVPATAGNVTVTLNGISKTVAIDPAVETTTDLVAAKIRGTFFSGWVASGTGSTVVLTSTTTGTKTDAVYSAGTTGATGTMSTTTQGIAEATTTIVAAAIRAATYTGWTTGGTGSVVTFTATTVGTRTAPTFSGGSTGAAATFARTVLGEAANYHRYFWNGSAWTDGGIYQAIDIGSKSITESKLADRSVSPTKLVSSYNLLNSSEVTESSVIIGYDLVTLLPIVYTGGGYAAHFVSSTKIPNVGKLLIKVSEITAGNAMMMLDTTGKRVAHFNLASLKTIGTSYGIIPYAKYFTTYWEIDIAKLRAAYPTVSTLLLQFLTADREVAYINGIDVVNIFDYEWVNDKHVSDMINDAHSERVGYPFDSNSSCVFNKFNYKAFTDCVKDIVIYGATKDEQFYIINAHKLTATTFSIAIAKVGYTGGAVGNELVCNAVFNMTTLDMTTDKVTKLSLSANNQSVKYAAELFINLSDYPTDLPAAGLPSGVLNVSNASISVVPSAIPVHPFASKATLKTRDYDYLSNAQAIKDIKLYGAQKTDQLYIKNMAKIYSGTYGEDCLTISIAKEGYTGGVAGEELVCNAVKPISQIDFVSDKITEFQLSINNSSVTYWAMLYINFKEFLTDSPNVNIGNTVMPISNLCIQPSQSALDPTEIILPSKYVAAQGRETNLYYDNILYKNSAAKLRRARVSNFDKYYKDEARLLASTTKLGDYASSVSLWTDGDTSADYTKSFMLKVVDDAAGSGVTKNILLIGDSLTDSNVIANELYTLFSTDVMDINLLGTRGSTGKHEGRSGWSMYDYAFFAQGSQGFVGTNPFFNPATGQFDLAYYMTNQGYTGVDYVFLNLGTNDNGRTSDANFNLSVETILASIKAYNANAKVGLWVSPLPSQLEDNQSSKDYFLAFNKKVITSFDNREADGLYLVPVYLNIDLVNDFQTETVAISSRNAATVKRLVDNIHPATAGYLKFADTEFSYIKYFASI